jgi:ABC-2 type transport system permease protein
MTTAEQVLEPRDIRGPSAAGGGWQRFLHLTWTIGFTDFRLTYFGSALGYLWSLMRPLLSFAVLLVVFTQIFDAGQGVRFFAVQLLLGVVLFAFFAEATSTAVQSVIARESLVRKMQFPRLVIPLSVVLTAALNLLVSLVPVIIFALASGVPVRATWLLLPVAVVALAAVSAGVAMALSSLYVRFRDVAPIWSVFSQVLFYGSPVIYTIDKVPGDWKRVVLANPVASIVQLARAWVVDPTAGTPAAVMGGFGWGLIPLAVGALVLGFGLWIFSREAPGIAERL